MGMEQPVARNQGCMAEGNNPMALVKRQNLRQRNRPALQQESAQAHGAKASENGLALSDSAGERGRPSEGSPGTRVPGGQGSPGGVAWQVHNYSPGGEGLGVDDPVQGAGGAVSELL